MNDIELDKLQKEFDVVADGDSLLSPEELQQLHDDGAELLQELTKVNIDSIEELQKSDSITD